MARPMPVLVALALAAVAIGRPRAATADDHFELKIATVAPDKTPWADLKNKKMRSQESYVHIEMWKALGASASAIPTTEVTTALKTGSVEGFDQALLYMVAGAWHTSIKHLTLSAHIYQPAVITFNQD